MQRIIERAETARKPIHLCAPRESAANNFNQRHGLIAQSEDDSNINDERSASTTPSPRV